jgi:hypothetical protein
MDAKILAAAINAAINELLKKGSASAIIKSWRDELERVLDEAATSPADASDSVQRYYQNYLDRIIEVRGLPMHSIVSADDKQVTAITGFGMNGNFELLLPKMRRAFDSCVNDVKAQAEQFRQRELLDVLNTFEQWARSIPLGGTKEKSFRDEARSVRQILKAFSKWDKYYFYAKRSNFSNEINRIIAESNGAIAALWHFYDCEKPMHKERDKKVYLIRGNWAIEKGFIDDHEAKFTDDLPLPGNDGCMCSYCYLSHVGDLPAELLTPKGKNAKKEIEHKFALMKAGSTLNASENRPVSLLGGFIQSIKKFF